MREIQCVDRLPRATTEAERRYPGRLDGEFMDVSGRLLARPEGPYFLRSATDTVVHIFGTVSRQV